MMSGCPASNAKSDPATQDTIRVSGIPIRFSVLSPMRPPKATAPDRAAK